MKDFFLKAKPYLFPVIALLAINLLYFYPILQGKLITQDDIMMGLAKNKEIREYREQKGEEPLWTQAMFSGMPAFQISTDYPNNIFRKVASAFSYVGKPSSIYIIALLMVGFYILLITQGVKPWLSFAGAIAFGFSSFFIISHAAGHNAKVRTAAYIPMIIAGILLVYQGKKWLGTGLTALFVGLGVASNHFQIIYYLAFAIACIVIAYGIEAVKNKTLPQFIQRSLFLALAATIGMGPNLGNLINTREYTKETMRGGSSELSSKEESKGGLDFDYAMSWSYGRGETFTLFIPDFMGGGAKQDYSNTETFKLLSQTFASQGMGKKKAEDQANQYAGSFLYWGDQSLVNGGYYLGASIFFLFILGLLLIKGTTRNWIIAATVISLFLGWGKHFRIFNEFLFDYFPLFNKFRVPSMGFVVLYCTIPFTAILGVNKIISGEFSKKEIKQHLLTALYIAGGIALFAAFLGPVFFSLEGLRDAQLQQQGFDISLLHEDRASLMRSSALKSLVFVGLTFGLIWYFLQGKLSQKLFPFALAGIFIVDLWIEDKDQLGKEEFVSKKQFESTYAPSAADLQILKDPDPHYRVFNPQAGLTSDSYTSYYHKNIGGYHGAKLIRYQDLIENQLSQNNQKVLDMLNAKYFLFSDKQGNKQAQQNPNALGNAWFVNEIIWAENADEEMAKLSEFTPGTQVVIDQRYKADLGSLSLDKNAGTISLSSYDPKEMVYEANISAGSQLAVFSEIYYEGAGEDWKAYIDGEHVPHHRVNYLLRGLVIPQGKHTITFKFEPATYALGNKLDLAASLAFVLFFGFAIWRNQKEKKD